MGYMDTIRNLINRFKGLISRKTGDLQPKDILAKIIVELEKRKKLGIEENAFVPNVYLVYLAPSDYEELSPLLSGIKDQLKSKLMDKVKRCSYKILSSSLSIEIRQDAALMKSQVVIESSFLKEKLHSALSEKNDSWGRQVLPPQPGAASEKTPNNVVPLAPASATRNVLTKIVEDKKTKIIDSTKVQLEIVDGDGKGEFICLKEGEYTFGRGRDASILIKDIDETVSRMHFKLIVKEGLLKIKDLDSANGTRVNDIDIEEAELKKGDTIAAGKVLLRVA
jgi:hypothetical protein